MNNCYNPLNVFSARELYARTMCIVGRCYFPAGFGTVCLAPKCRGSL